MATERRFKCETCGFLQTTENATKRFCDRTCKDRSYTKAYRRKPLITWETIEDLRHFGKLDDPGKQRVLLGEAGFSVVSFDIEATHLNGNIGRILCASFKPLGGEPYTFSALDRRFREKDVYNDGKLAAAIRDELESYDIIVSWNGKMFDVKYVNARALGQGLRAKKPQYHVDGMWAWRSKVRAWSGLDSVQKHILPGGDSKTSISWPQWMRALGWDKTLREEAMAEIIEHCEIDVAVLEDVYRFLVKNGIVNNIRKDGGIL